MAASLAQPLFTQTSVCSAAFYGNRNGRRWAAGFFVFSLFEITLLIKADGNKGSNNASALSHRTFAACTMAFDAFSGIILSLGEYEITLSRSPHFHAERSLDVRSLYQNNDGKHSPPQASRNCIVELFLSPAAGAHFYFPK